ncbi:30S ribosomal protein S9 [Cerasicoccus arenae]|uniref:Small ribosomal subunit protein uS9 n=1 Tax=Cerasicoccus arenae TaxID=424488 RepID=A0A8J3GBV8_9BACT|nr:30S ribosomal protein S9 [Cerasicoccus arenae]MBK1856959.1 30S ribosomal protein S9 [Cerasicoccus arenae]GHB90058.1 30S ribosomal protein S9 [Cerasicoccus arenae]
MTETQTVFTAVGRRKTSSARVRLIQGGTGKFTINGRTFEDYCFSESMQRGVARPLDITESKTDFDVVILVEGGGPTGQTGAMAHGIARALQKFNPELRPVLKKAGLIRRDPRMKERKKSGQPGARKRFQFSKR